MKIFHVWGWGGLSKIDACASVEAETTHEAATRFMKTYPFNKKYWKPHKLQVAEQNDDVHITIFMVTSLEPLEIHGPQGQKGWDSIDKDSL